MSNAKKLLTLCFVYDSSRVLLGMKKRGFGAGRWNGFGGKVNGDETIEEAAVRELREESGIAPTNISQRGALTFVFTGDPVALEVHVFAVGEYEGEPHETEEMRPQWFLHSEIPFDLMWPDDRYWLPLFLARKKFEGEFVFADQNTIKEHSLKEV
ncbi:8-oxo-dGTP diphosphatase [Candidatus Azambacteria bacterium]|nr:8-oxo-dGTP diphosphatase [Candidatus Azambacteria bacterium]MBI3685564.1 8-oxo-dGTP diphosphatase [Candidatus Azambacteria bacterium]